MTNYQRLFSVELQPHHRPTGRTTHRIGNESLPIPSSLAIVQYPGESGFYLLYLDNSGEELTDTLHDTVNAAMEQAKWEFEVEPHEWTSVSMSAEDS